MSYSFGLNPKEVVRFTSQCTQCDLSSMFLENCRVVIDVLLDPQNRDESRIDNRPVGVGSETKQTLHLALDKKENNLKTYIAHFLRRKHESSALEDKTRDLGPIECVIVVDYKMKLLSMYQREWRECHQCLAWC